MSSNKIFTIGIAGGSGSGKTLIVENIIKTFAGEVCYLKMDNYYKAHHDIDFEDRKQINFDSPDAFDMELLYDHIEKLQNGQSVNTPIYDFTIHDRSNKTVTIEPKKIIIVDGILALYFEKLCSFMDTKIFVDVDDDIRILRRTRRDILERGRTIESVFDQYVSTVKPSFEKYIRPSRVNANLIIPQGGYNKVAIGVIIDHIKNILENNEKSKDKADKDSIEVK